MKRFLPFLILFLPSLVKAESQVVGGQWKGLHNSDASIMIGDNEAQDLRDVDLTPSGFGVTKRSGYSQYKTIGVSTWQVRGGYYFRDAGGNDEIIHTNNKTIFKSVNGAAYSSITTTDTAGSYYDFTDSNGVLWRANNNRDIIKSYNGTTLTSYASLPQGDQIEAGPDRLMISGTSANPNRLHFSKRADFSNFTAGIEDADPFTEDVGLPGQRIQAAKYVFDKLLFWTKDTFSYWFGTNQYDGIIGPIDNTVGTVQPNTVIYDIGRVYWQGQDKHFYSFDGNIVTSISNKYLDVSNIIGGESKSWETSSQSEFQTGTIPAPLSAIVSPGDITFSTGSLVDDFSDNNFTSLPTWSTKTTGATPGVFDASSGYMQATSYGSFMGMKTSISQSTGAWSYTFQRYSGSGSTLNIHDFKLCNGGSFSLGTEAGCYLFQFQYLTSTTTRLTAYAGASSLSVADMTTNLMDGLQHTIIINRGSGGVFNISVDGISERRFTNTSITGFDSIQLLFQGANPTVYRVDDISFKYFIGTYQSTAFNIGTSISDWGAFQLNQSLSNGSITYAVYSDSNSSITINSANTWISSQTITNGAIPSFAVKPYLTWTASFTRSVSTQSASLNDVTQNWYEGGLVIRNFASVDTDHRILFTVAETTGSSSPSSANVTYIYDPFKDDGAGSPWTKYHFPFLAPARVGSNIYFGGTGVVNKWPSSNSDSGTAITAYWKSKDFIAPDPFSEKEYKSLNLIAKSDSGSNVDVTYNINTSSPVVYNISLTDSDGNYFVRNNRYLPSGAFGTFFNFKFGNDDADAPFEVYAVKYDYDLLPWRVLP